MLGKANSSGFPATVDTPLVSASVAACTSRQNFQYFAVFFGINHAAAAIPLLYATTALVGSVGYTSSGILYISTMIGALIIAAPAVQALGAKKALLVAMTLYSSYVLSITLAVSRTDEFHQQVLVYCGAFFGGIGASLLWTAQGTYFSTSARHSASFEGKSYREMTSEQGSTFAFWFLLFEVTFRLGCFALQSMQIADTVVFGLCVFSAGASTIASAMLLSPLHNEAQEDPKPFFDNMSAFKGILTLAQDSRIWCFAFTNLTFGLSAGYMNGYVNEELSSVHLGEASIGILTAATSICAVGLAILYGCLAVHVGKGVVIMIGACSMFVIPVCTLFAQPASWGWGIALLYVMQGSARAIYEGINRAVFAEAFDDQTENAFALCSAQSSFAFALSFFASEATRKGTGAAVLVMVLAALTYPLYVSAQTRPASASKEEEYDEKP
jgi:hypothetical protein